MEKFRTKKNSQKKFFASVILILFFVSSVLGFYRFDRKILPLVLEAAELRIQTEINNVINSVVHEIIVKNKISASDFILQNENLSVNTILVNEICNAAAQGISARLNNLEPEVASVPIGISIVPKLQHMYFSLISWGLWGMVKELDT